MLPTPFGFGSCYPAGSRLRRLQVGKPAQRTASPELEVESLCASAADGVKKLTPNVVRANIKSLKTFGR
ncbi:MAG: hypothetical protein KME46_27905 [Brasilonema angustatum HA4187-MV1]|jgi:hypothetical protein|nr:hypothetical protein [Brasilonema angustatum HA4187-MV1]